jgi:hypothetical protein
MAVKFGAAKLRMPPLLAAMVPATEAGGSTATRVLFCRSEQASSVWNEIEGVWKHA